MVLWILVENDVCLRDIECFWEILLYLNPLAVCIFEAALVEGYYFIDVDDWFVKNFDLSTWIHNLALVVFGSFLVAALLSNDVLHPLKLQFFDSLLTVTGILNQLASLSVNFLDHMILLSDPWALLHISIGTLVWKLFGSF
jgi:hypothetical protein